MLGAIYGNFPVFFFSYSYLVRAFGSAATLCDGLTAERQEKFIATSAAVLSNVRSSYSLTQLAPAFLSLFDMEESKLMWRTIIITRWK